MSTSNERYKPMGRRQLRASLLALAVSLLLGFWSISCSGTQPGGL